VGNRCHAAGLGIGALLLVGILALSAALVLAAPAFADHLVAEFDVPRGTGPHDVAPAPDGTVWFTAQRSGELGRLDPASGQSKLVPLGPGSSPHGVVVGPDGAAWVTDSGLNAMVRVDGKTHQVKTYPLPPGSRYANLNTPVLDPQGIVWFTGQAGIYGRLDPRNGQLQVWNAPRGYGPYGIAATPAGDVYYVSLAGSYLGKIDTRSGQVSVLDPPTPGQGARRVWGDSRGRLWISEWNAGQLGRYDPRDGTWQEWRVPGQRPAPYAVYVDERDRVWLSDFGSNSIVRFDPDSEGFTFFRIPTGDAAVRQLHGRPGEVWGAESSADRLIRIQTHE
jgi:virginiamycin B lyase